MVDEMAPAPNGKKLSKAEALDVRVASSLVLNPLLQDDGISALQQAAQSASDLPAAMALAIFQALGQVKDAVKQKGIPLSSKIWTAAGGVLDVVIKDVCQALASVPPEIPEAADPGFMQDVKEEVFNLMEGNGQQGAPAPQEGMPSQGPPQQPAGPPNMLAPQGGGMM